MFGASTVQWAWGLDGVTTAGLPAPPDLAMQQATVNLLADMGAQPGSLQATRRRRTGSTDALPPTSTIGVAGVRRHVGSGDRVIITGTAPTGGGAVAGVEVSVDGGTTWHAAQGTTAWTFDGWPARSGPPRSGARAIDDSGNREMPGAGIAVTVGAGGCPCPSLWSAVDSRRRSPTSTTEPGRARPEVPQRRRRLHQRRALLQGIGNSGTHVGNLWTSTGTLLAHPPSTR